MITRYSPLHNTILMDGRPYIELLQPKLEDAPRLSILKSKYNRIAIRLNGFYQIFSEQEIREGMTPLKYFEQEITTYDKFSPGQDSPLHFL